MSTELLPGFEADGVLLSIRPTFANLIASGGKTVELRRRFPAVPSGTTLVIYATQPVAAVLGITPLRCLTASTLPVLWRKFGVASAVTRETFDLYFTECTRGIAIELEAFEAFTPPIPLTELRGLWPAFAPPQSYRYVPLAVLRKLDARSSAATKPRASAARPAGPQR
jgi:predicted transcriptional regulator